MITSFLLNSVPQEMKDRGSEPENSNYQSQPQGNLEIETCNKYH